ncbi:flagellar basal body rod protein FlgB [Roseivivax sp. CAU 1753]
MLILGGHGSKSMNFDSISLFDLASKRLNWLAERQQVVSENVANADTPGFRAQDVVPFEELLERPTISTSLATTQAGHLTGNLGSYTAAAVIADETAWEKSINGNTVVLEQQIIKATEIEDGYQLATDLYRKAHQLLTLATTGRR